MPDAVTQNHCLNDARRIAAITFYRCRNADAVRQLSCTGNPFYSYFVLFLVLNTKKKSTFRQHANCDKPKSRLFLCVRASTEALLFLREIRCHMTKLCQRRKAVHCLALHCYFCSQDPDVKDQFSDLLLFTSCVCGFSHTIEYTEN